MAWMAVGIGLVVAAVSVEWQPVKPGLELASIRMPITSSFGDNTLVVARIDPNQCSLHLISAVALDQDARPVTHWAVDFRLHAVINAGMFHASGLPVARARSDGKDVQPAWSMDKALLVAGPLRKELAPAQIVDRSCHDLRQVADGYATLLQGIRMVDCKRQVMWQAQQKMWSIAALAMDDRGRLLMLHSRSPYPVHTFAKTLLTLPLGIVNMMYMEGGPEASLYVGTFPQPVVRVGSYETGFNEDDGNEEAWNLPNVIGARCR